MSDSDSDFDLGAPAPSKKPQEGTTTKEVVEAEPTLNLNAKEEDNTESSGPPLSRWVCYIHSPIDHLGGTIVGLPHPKTNQTTRYAIVQSQLFEIQSHQQSHNSYFVDDAVVADGAMYIFTPVDPLFLLLPTLTTKTGGESRQFRSDADIFEGFGSLRTVLSNENVALVCETTDVDGELFLRVDENRVIAWLRVKVTALKDCKEIHNRYASTINATNKDEQYRKMLERGIELVCLGIVSDYLPNVWKERLAKSYGLEPALLEGKAPQQETGVGVKRSRDEGKESEAPAAPAARSRSLNQKRLAQVNKKGMQPLTAFFGKKK